VVRTGAKGGVVQGEAGVGRHHEVHGFLRYFLWCCVGVAVWCVGAGVVWVFILGAEVVVAVVL